MIFSFWFNELKLIKGMKTKDRTDPKTKNTVLHESAEFPGYPPYDPQEDITQQAQRVEGNLDDETLNKDRTRLRTPVPKTLDTTGMAEGVEDDVTPISEYDVTEEDLEALGPKDLSLDMGDDEDLKHRITPVDFSGDDLDVPGAELDDAAEEIGSGDEENNSYSQ
jgi:hypothetical protein